MTPNLMGLLALAPLVVLLLMVTRQDIRSRRIPNKLVLIGLVLGVVLNGLLPEGQGFNRAIPGGLGWLAALKGLVVGMAVLLPIYWLRAMGAGDVKLMAMVGAFLGSADVLGAVLVTFIAGGVMALAVVLWSRQLRQMLLNVKLILLGGFVKMSAGQTPLMNDLPVSVGKLPYAVAITVGTLAYLVWQRVGWM
ncbi:MAG: A24 family peptidase [Methylotenera sp.]|nr:A24 family peptidase [Methylotenera sp.]MDP1959193.1 A24 family peptidase [Methylotenera sp.]MDP3943015.1 A24 family peptidase [Methylotenera sp.]